MILIISTIIAAFFQAIWNLNFPAAILTFFPEKYWLAFGVGLLSDLLLGGLLGFTACFNVIYIGLIILFKQKFAFNWRWAVLFIVVSQIVWLYVWRGNF